MIGWIDASAGASGDMLLGALVDVGVPPTVLEAAVEPLGLGVSFTSQQVTRGGLRACKVDVVVPDDPQPRRTLDDVLALLDRVEEPVRSRATEVFRRLAAAEAHVHGTTVDAVHFHEVGALDAIADVVGVVAGLRHLGLTSLHAGPVALGHGTASTAHGRIPVPAPAVLELLRGCPVTQGPTLHEATTPTGAALLATAVTAWDGVPAMLVDGVGHGAGGRDPDGYPNVLRLVTGEPTAARGGRATATVLETNVDDMDPRLWPDVLERLLAAGAADAWLTPIQMKKGRPAHTLHVLVGAAERAAVEEVVLTATTTIGLRATTIEKVALARSTDVVHVDGHAITVKLAHRDGQVVNRSVEWEDVLSVAALTGMPAKEVLRRATAALGDS